MPFHVSLVGRTDLSGEIYRQIRRAILDGRLKAGDRLSPSREIARAHAISRMTVTVAYERLAAEGFVTSRVGDGTFVHEGVVPLRRIGVGRSSSTGAQPRADWQTIPLSSAFKAPALFDFRTGLPDLSLFPHRSWRRLASRTLRTADPASGVYGHPAGLAELRSAIARHIGFSRGIGASVDDVVVTNGTQQALDVAARALLAPGERIAIEDPCYQPPRYLFQSLGLEVVGVPVDDEGVVVDAIPRGVRAIYVTPSHQYPLGVVMTLRRRQALLAWADRTNAAVIEDDYDSEFRFHGRPLEPLQALDTRGRVLYVGSFSKTMLPTLRLGFIVAPPALQDALHKAKYVSDWHTTTIVQLAVARFIEDGAFSRHIRKASAVYLERHAILARAIAKDFADDLQLVPSESGLHLAVLARRLSAEQVATAAGRAAGLGVAVQLLSNFAVGPPRAGLVLGYGAIPTSRIKEGLRRLKSSLTRA